MRMNVDESWQYETAFSIEDSMRVHTVGKVSDPVKSSDQSVFGCGVGCIVTLRETRSGLLDRVIVHVSFVDDRCEMCQMP